MLGQPPEDEGPDPANDSDGNELEDVEKTDDERAEREESIEDNHGDGFIREKDVAKVSSHHLSTSPPLDPTHRSLPHIPPFLCFYIPRIQVPGPRSAQPRARRLYLNFINGLGYMLNIHIDFIKNHRQMTAIEVWVFMCVVCVMLGYVSVRMCVCILFPPLVAQDHYKLSAYQKVPFDLAWMQLKRYSNKHIHRHIQKSIP